MPEELGTHVALAVLALLCYRLLFCSTRELSLTALLFCAACAWSAGQLAAVAGGAGSAYNGSAYNAGAHNAGAHNAGAHNAGAHNATGFAATGFAATGFAADFVAAPARAAAAAARAARAVCANVGLSAAAREACWDYTKYFAQDDVADDVADEPASSSP